jgi:Nuclease-related domain
MFAQFIHSIAATRPVWVTLGRAKFLQWIQGLEAAKQRAQARALPLPGESTRQQLQELDARMTDSFIVEAGLACIVIIGLMMGREPGTSRLNPVWQGIFALCGVAAVACALRLKRMKQERRNLWLAFHGERVVGEELNGLSNHGYYVFHDLPLTENWNIDHIVVGPSGVYAVETKVQRIPEQKAGPISNELVYDGKGLQFPDHYDAKRLAQTRAQAERLENFLSSKIGNLIEVKPVLTVPGWSVRYTAAESRNSVMSPKTLRAAILNDKEPILSAERIQRIVDQLEQKY